MAKYNPSEIEPKWQSYWAEHKTFRTGTDHSKQKFYCLDMFPYPSGAGLHVGHPEGYTATDIVCRYKRSCGFNVLHPMGWDAFGLPAEQYAIQTGTHPSVTTKKNCDTFRRQIQRLGLSYDWDREIATCPLNHLHRGHTGQRTIRTGRNRAARKAAGSVLRGGAQWVAKVPMDIDPRYAAGILH